MLGINKITVADQLDERGNAGYIITVGYYLETEKDEFGLPSLDLSQDTRLYAYFNKGSASTLVKGPSSTLVMQKLTYPTYIEGSLNPAIVEVGSGFRYPFEAQFTISSSDAENFEFEIVLMRGKYLSGKHVKPRIRLFSSNSLNIENDDGIAIEDQRNNFYNDLFNFDVFSIGQPKNTANVSDLMLSYSKDATVRGLFVFDKQQFLIDNSKFGKILQNDSLPRATRNFIMNKSSIDRLHLSRMEVGYIRDFQNKPHDLLSNQVAVTVADASESDNNLNATRGIMEYIPTITMGDIEHEKVIGFSDSRLDVGGSHQYILDLTLKDGILSWLITSLNTLTRIQDKLIRGVAQLPKRGLVSVATISRLLVSLNRDIDLSQRQISSYIENLTKFEGSRNVLKYNMVNLINSVSTLIGKSGLISQTNSAYSKIYSKNTSDLFFLKMNKAFDAIADFDDARSLTYDYMGIRANSDTGASTVTKEEFESRAKMEFSKLIRNQEGTFANLSRDIYGDVFGFSKEDPTPLEAAYFNFEPNYNVFFAPIRVGSLDITVENSFDFDLMTAEHFKKTFDSSYGSGLSVSYYLQEKGCSVGNDFFQEDPPLNSKSSKQSYIAANQLFSDSNLINNASAVEEPYDASFDLPSDIGKTFASAFLRNDEGWNLSKSDFDLNNKTNRINAITTSTNRRTADGPALSQQLQIVREMPNQIRAIFASRSDKCVNQWLSPSMEGDYIYDPNTYYTIKQNYMNLVKVEYIVGFKKDSIGVPDIKNPIFEKLGDLNTEGRFICRASIYSDDRFKIGSGFDKIIYADKYFILEVGS